MAVPTAATAGAAIVAIMAAPASAIAAGRDSAALTCGSFPSGGDAPVSGECAAPSPPFFCPSSGADRARRGRRTAAGAAVREEGDRLEGAGLEVSASDDFRRTAGVAFGVRRAGAFAGAAEGCDARVLAGTGLPLAGVAARPFALGFAVAPRAGAGSFIAGAELVAEEARLPEGAAGFSGCRTGFAAARGLRVAFTGVALAPGAARDMVLALAAAGLELAFRTFALVLLGVGAARRADTAADFLGCLAEVVVPRAPRAMSLLAALLVAAARGAAARRLAAGVAFLVPAADVGLRSAFAGWAPRTGVFTATLRAAGAFDAAGLPARGGAAVLALPRVGVVALRGLRAAVGTAPAFRTEAAGLLRVADADERRPAEAALERGLPGGASLSGRFAMGTSERSGRLASNRFA